MRIKNYYALSVITYREVPGVALRHMRDLRGKRAENIELRIFQIEPGATTPFHSHAHAHDVLILHGGGLMRQAGDEQVVKAGDVVSIAADEPHSFTNNGMEVLEFVCLDWAIAEGQPGQPPEWLAFMHGLAGPLMKHLSATTTHHTIPDRVTGVGMIPAMLAKARRSAAEAQLSNVEFHEGYAESLPVPDGWGDVVISNGVLNLVPDKDKALAEVHRVLKPGGRFQIADILLQKPVPENSQSDVSLWTGCIAGGLLKAQLERKVKAAGFEDFEVVWGEDVFSGAPQSSSAAEFGTLGVTLRARKQTSPSYAGRILTDASGPFFTQVAETEVSSLAEWERRIADVFSLSGVGDRFGRMQPMVESGRREFYDVEA